MRYQTGWLLVITIAHSALAAQDFTAYAYALMTPVDELIKIMRQVDREAPSLRSNRFHPNDTPIQLEGDRYGKLVVAYHNKQRELNMDGLALQVSNAIMQETYPSKTLTKFICNIEARVFACMQTAPPQELNDNYDFHPVEDLTSKQPFCLCPAGVCWQY